MAYSLKHEKTVFEIQTWDICTPPPPPPPPRGPHSHFPMHANTTLSSGCTSLALRPSFSESLEQL